MKLTFTALLPWLLLACVSDATGEKPSSTPPADERQAPAARQDPAGPGAPGSPGGSDAMPPAAQQPTAAPDLPGTSGQAPAEPPAPPPAQVDRSTGLQGSGQAPVAPAPPAPPAPKPPLSTVQIPLAPPLPVPVVPGPPASGDPHQLSGANLGGPIRVHSKTIEEADLRRYLCYSVGGKQIESLKYDVLTQQEIEKRRAGGEDVSKLVVGDPEFDRFIDRTRKDFLLKYPTLDFPTEVGRAFLSLDIYKVEARRTMLFDKVFFPEDPETWPAVTTQAIIEAGGGEGFIVDAKESYAARKQMQIDQGLEDLPQDDPILVDTLRGWLLDALNKFAVVEFRQDHLPADALLVVEGVPITVDQVWSTIQPHVTWENVADTRRMLTMLALAQHELEQKGVLIPQDEFEQNFVPKMSFKDAIASYEMIAVTLQGFPSMQANLKYERLLRSYRKLIADELTDEKLQPFMPRANQIAGAAKTDAEIILASAFDWANFRWKPDGWRSAEAKAQEIKRKLDEGADWGDVLERQSEYWDPPMPEVGQKPPFGYNFKGRFGPQTRNQLIQDVHESDFTFFLRGKSVGDDIFFDQPAGTISDVKQGSRGFYIARVNARTPGQAGLNLNVPLNREFAVNYVAMNKFGAYARQLLTDALKSGAVSGF